MIYEFIHTNFEPIFKLNSQNNFLLVKNVIVTIRQKSLIKSCNYFYKNTQKYKLCLTEIVVYVFLSNPCRIHYTADILLIWIQTIY